MVGGLGKCGALPLLRTRGMLAHRPIQSLVRSTGYNLHHLLLQCHRLSLARIREYLVVHVCRSLRTGLWYWPQIRDGSHLCGGDGAPCCSWCVGHAVADVDGVWDYARIRCGLDLLPSRRSSRDRGNELAPYDGFGNVPGFGRLLLRLRLSRVPALVHE